VCVCIHTRVCVCPHTHVYTVCTRGGMCACKCMYWSTHTHPGTHPCVCMYACAPCPPRHDPCNRTGGRLYTCVHSVYMWRDVRMQMHVLVSTHTHPGTHACVCMYACAPCPPRHDPPLTLRMRQTGATPLYIAAQKGHTDTVLALLQAGATVDAKTKVRGALLSECMCVCFRIRVQDRMCVCV
jgi:hypothetical protein